MTSSQGPLSIAMLVYWSVLFCDFLYRPNKKRSCQYHWAKAEHMNLKHPKFLGQLPFFPHTFLSQKCNQMHSVQTLLNQPTGRIQRALWHSHLELPDLLTTCTVTCVANSSLCWWCDSHMKPLRNAQQKMLSDHAQWSAFGPTPSGSTGTSGSDPALGLSLNFAARRRPSPAKGVEFSQRNAGKLHNWVAVSTHLKIKSLSQLGNFPQVSGWKSKKQMPFETT